MTNKFHYSSYWGKWNRVLQWQNFSGAKRVFQIEVDLQPINSWDPSAWEKTAKINIRKHCTSPARKDIDSKTLPLYVAKQMIKILGRPLVERLLYEDFLSKIDWEKYERSCNGGASFEAIKLDQSFNKYEIQWQPHKVDPEQIRKALQQVQFTTHENGIEKVPRELISAARYAIEKLQRELATVNSAMQKIDGMIAVDDKTVLDAMLLIDTILNPQHSDPIKARRILNALSTYRAIGPINNRDQA